MSQYTIGAPLPPGRDALDTLRRIAVDHGPLFWDPIIVQGVLAIMLLGALDLFHRALPFANSGGDI